MGDAPVRSSVNLRRNETSQERAKLADFFVGSRSSAVGRAASVTAPLRGSAKRPPDERFQYLKSRGKWQHTDGNQMILAELPERPGVVICYRTASARDRSPDRLHLDRRSLTVCPVLEREDRLRLLNYQNNRIERIDNLNFPNLVFLDLYDNQVDQIDNLHQLQNLRVLMLGKNHVRKIENLDALTKLDVLDLHSNRIKELANMQHLTELRVLNFAGNQLHELSHLAGLTSLTELNIRRNDVANIQGLADLQIQRVFASHNCLTLENIQPLGCLVDLKELTLDGNPVCNVSRYRSRVHAICKGLVKLDQEKLPEITRGFDDQSKQDSGRHRSRLASAGHAVGLDQAAACSTQHTGPAVSAGASERSNSVGGSLSKRQERGRGAAQGQRLSSQEVMHEIRLQWAEATSSGHVPSIRYGYVRREHPHELNVYGRGLDALGKAEYQSVVSSISFHFITIEAILGENLVKFQHLDSLTFSENQIFKLNQLEPLARRPLKSLTIRENPVNEMRANLRLEAIFLFPTLTEFNGTSVNDTERAVAAQQYTPFQHVMGLTMLHGVKEHDQMSRRDSEQVALVVEDLIAQACECDRKLAVFHANFEEVVKSAIRDAWDDMQRLRAHGSCSRS